MRTEGRQQELAVRAALGAGRDESFAGCWSRARSSGSRAACSDWRSRAWASTAWSRGPVDPAASERDRHRRARARVHARRSRSLSGLLFGLDAGARSTPGRGSRRSLRGAGARRPRAASAIGRATLLVVAQVALALVLLVSSGLMIRTFQALRDVDPGLRGRTSFKPSRSPFRRLSCQSPIGSRACNTTSSTGSRAIPGVTSVAFASVMPMDMRDARLGRHPCRGQVVPEGRDPSACASSSRSRLVFSKQRARGSCPAATSPGPISTTIALS